MGDSATTLASKRQAVGFSGKSLGGVPSKNSFTTPAGMVLKPCKSWDIHYQPQLVFTQDFERTIQQYPDGGYTGIPVYQYLFWKGLLFFATAGLHTKMAQFDIYRKYMEKHISFQIFFLHICEHFRGFKIVGKE